MTRARNTRKNHATTPHATTATTTPAKTLISSSDDDEMPVAAKTVAAKTVAVAKTAENGNTQLLDGSDCFLERKWNVTISSPDGAAAKATIKDVPSLWRVLNNIPDAPGEGVTISIFEEGVAPTWEDPANEGAGRWMWTFTPSDEELPGSKIPHWKDAVLGILGEYNETQIPTVTGFIIAGKSGHTRVSVWCRKHSDEDLCRIGEGLERCVTLKNYSLKLEYQLHGAPYNNYRFVIVGTKPEASGSSTHGSSTRSGRKKP